MLYQLLLVMIGLGGSVYAYFLEKQLETNPAYKPACDISDRFSCVKPIKSKYAKLFGLSNGIVGIMFYALLAVSLFIGCAKCFTLLATAGLIACVWFAYILYVKIKTVCLVCTMLYVVNFLLFLSCW